MTQPHHLPRSDDAVSRETGPIFADPSGQRRRLMRALGAAASVMMVGALIVAGIGLFGGPDTPFSVFGTPIGHRHGHQDPANAGSRAGRSAPGAPGSGATGAPGGQRRSGPSPSRTSPRPTSSPTNRAGKSPPGRNRSRRPHPSPSPHSK